MLSGPKELQKLCLFSEITHHQKVVGLRNSSIQENCVLEQSVYGEHDFLKTYQGF